MCKCLSLGADAVESFCIASWFPLDCFRSMAAAMAVAAGTGESPDMVSMEGVWVREGLRDDFRVRGDCSILCFHSSRRFIDSSL